MNKNIKIAVIGGDLRQLVCAKELAEDGFEVAAAGFDFFENAYGRAVRCDYTYDAINSADIVILPVPYSYDGFKINCPLTKKTITVEEVVSKMNKKCLLLVGMANEVLYDMASDCGITVIDYIKNEELNILNATPTAEGAIAIALNEMPIILENSQALVVGYGRIGKVLSSKLNLLGSRVSVCARRRESLTWARACGCTPVTMAEFKNNAGKYDVIFNTVPEKIINKEIIDNIKSDCLVIDLASKPGGIDIEYAKEKKLNVIWALSIPGKVAPITAGRIIKETVISIINDTQERGALA